MIETLAHDNDQSRSKNALRAWLQLLKCAKRMEQLMSSRFRQEFTSSLSRFDVLANLHLAKEQGQGSMSTTQLAKLLLASKGNITRLLDRMEEDGLIYRRPNASDRRISDVYLSDRGEAIFDEMANEHELWTDDIFNVLSHDETLELIELVSKIRHKVDHLITAQR